MHYTEGYPLLATQPDTSSCVLTQVLAVYFPASISQLRDSNTRHQASMPVHPVLRSAFRLRAVARGPATTAFYTASFHTSLPAQNMRRRTVQHNSSGKDPAATSRGTDFSSLDIFGDTPAPSTSVDMCMSDGFRLNNGAQVSNGDGILLVGGEAFSWRPWAHRDKRLVNAKGQWEVDSSAFELLGMVWPRPGRL